jgi:hypothetical protein
MYGDMVLKTQAHRVRNNGCKVTARIPGPQGRVWTVPLAPYDARKHNSHHKCWKIIFVTFFKVFGNIAGSMPQPGSNAPLSRTPLSQNPAHAHSGDLRLHA